MEVYSRVVATLTKRNFQFIKREVREKKIETQMLQSDDQVTITCRSMQTIKEFHKLLVCRMNNNNNTKACSSTRELPDDSPSLSDVETPFHDFQMEINSNFCAALPGKGLQDKCKELKRCFQTDPVSISVPDTGQLHIILECTKFVQAQKSTQKIIDLVRGSCSVNLFRLDVALVSICNTVTKGKRKGHKRKSTKAKAMLKAKKRRESTIHVSSPSTTVSRRTKGEAAQVECDPAPDEAYSFGTDAEDIGLLSVPVTDSEMSENDEPTSKHDLHCKLEASGNTASSVTTAPTLETCSKPVNEESTVQTSNSEDAYISNTDTSLFSPHRSSATFTKKKRCSTHTSTDLEHDMAVSSDLSSISEGEMDTGPTHSGTNKIHTGTSVSPAKHPTVVRRKPCRFVQIESTSSDDDESSGDESVESDPGTFNVETAIIIGAVERETEGKQICPLPTGSHDKDSSVALLEKGGNVNDIPRNDSKDNSTDNSQFLDDETEGDTPVNQVLNETSGPVTLPEMGFKEEINPTSNAAVSREYISTSSVVDVEDAKLSHNATSAHEDLALIPLEAKQPHENSEGDEDEKEIRKRLSFDKSNCSPEVCFHPTLVQLTYGNTDTSHSVVKDTSVDSIDGTQSSREVATFAPVNDQVGETMKTRSQAVSVDHLQDHPDAHASVEAFAGHSVESTVEFQAASESPATPSEREASVAIQEHHDLTNNNDKNISSPSPIVDENTTYVENGNSSPNSQASSDVEDLASIGSPDNSPTPASDNPKITPDETGDSESPTLVIKETDSVTNNTGTCPSETAVAPDYGREISVSTEPAAAVGGFSTTEQGTVGSFIHYTDEYGNILKILPYSGDLVLQNNEEAAGSSVKLMQGTVTPAMATDQSSSTTQPLESPSFTTLQCGDLLSMALSSSVVPEASVPGAGQIVCDASKQNSDVMLSDIAPESQCIDYTAETNNAVEGLIISQTDSQNKGEDIDSNLQVAIDSQRDSAFLDQLLSGESAVPDGDAMFPNQFDDLLKVSDEVTSQVKNYAMVNIEDSPAVNKDKVEDQPSWQYLEDPDAADQNPSISHPFPTSGSSREASEASTEESSKEDAHQRHNPVSLQDGYHCVNSRYYCTRCVYQAATEDRMIKHQRIVHPFTCRPINCDVCNQVFENVEMLNLHYQAKRKIVSSKYSCFGNMNLFHTRNSMKMCQTCSFTTSFEDLIYHHVYTTHCDDAFFCVECQQNIDSLGQYNDHMLTTHLG